MIHNYKELDVWKKSVAFTTELYQLTSGFPSAERFGLISQIRRAAVSIAANIAEGWGRGSIGEYIQFLMVARGSLMEVETHLIVSCNLHLISPDALGVVSGEIEEIGKMLNGLIGALKSRKARA
ncbi:MAG: four helix bundle protein [Terriglobia bacterium]